MSPLEFLKKSENSKVAEAIATRAIISSISLEAANMCNHIEVYTPNIDKDGYDLIVEEQEGIRKFQLKTVIGSTQKWYINRRLLRPSPYTCDRLGYSGAFDGTGLEGGVILTEITEDHGKIQLCHSYTDIYIISAFEHGIISRSKTAKSKVAWNKHCELTEDVYGTVSASEGIFLKPKTDKDLLALMGLFTTVDDSIEGPFRQPHRWRDHVLDFGSDKSDRISYANYAFEILSKICKDDIYCLHKHIAADNTQLASE